MSLVVDTGTVRYPVATLADPAALVAELRAVVGDARIFVVTDTRVRPLHGNAVANALADAGSEVSLVEVPEGEAAKTIDGVASVWDALLESRITRDDVIVALGGGAVGDVAGFAAATVLRGVRWVQVPTTLLAMADAGIGGKTGVNARQGKNLIGAFHHPLAVLCCTAFLDTLDARSFRAGLAEVVKSALIVGEPALREVESDVAGLNLREPGATVRAVRMAAALKCDVVSRDPDERGLRRVLNLGHTFGHAIESASGGAVVQHGEAVSVGLVMALRLGETRVVTDAGLAERVGRVLDDLGLPTSVPALGVEAWMSPLERDKKAVGTDIRFVFCRRPGEVFDERVELRQIRSWLTSVAGEPA